MDIITQKQVIEDKYILDDGAPFVAVNGLLVIRIQGKLKEIRLNARSVPTGNDVLGARTGHILKHYSLAITHILLLHRIGIDGDDSPLALQSGNLISHAGITRWNRGGIRWKPTTCRHNATAHDGKSVEQLMSFCFYLFSHEKDRDPYVDEFAKIEL